ncbi:MAG TPA: nodulation protein NfeD [Bryobacteraceae bacterium]|nr:nodulation protein NfeD [Bryobacteraceae bacterium]
MRWRSTALIALALFTATGQVPVPQAPVPRVIAVPVDGVVHPITVEIINHAIEQAQAQHAAVLLIRLDTPGGLLDATRQIIQQLSASPIPVVTYVTPSGARAASAGFFVLEAGDVAAMSPGTNTGAASPVLMGQQMDPVMREKVENDAAALLRSMTSRRGRNSQLAEDAVRKAKAFTEKEALDQKLIDLIASNEQQLFKDLDGREITRWDGRKEVLHVAGAIVTEVRTTLRERLISSIADPNIGFILLVLGALGIYVEFSSPGLIFAGVAGAILFLLGLSSLTILPVNWVGVALLLLSVTLFVLEAKFTSHGVLGIGGTISMVLGAMLLINGPPEVRIHFTTAVAVAVPFAAITMFLVSIVIQARRNKVLTGADGMIGEEGLTRTGLEPEGQVLVRGEIWDAVASANIPAGARVRVKGMAGLKLLVEPVP